MSSTYSQHSAWIWTPLSAAAAVVGLRIWVRIKVSRVSTEDYLMLTGISCYLLGAAVDQAAVYDRTFIDDLNPVKAIKETTAASVLLAIGLFSSKLSIATLLLRLLERTTRWQRTIIIATSITLFFTTILQVLGIIMLPCDSPQPWAVSSCFANDQAQLGFLQLSNFYNAFFDILYSLLPTSFLYHLKIKRSRKILIILSLSLGWIAATFAILRAISSWAWAYDADADDFVRSLATVLEAALVVICGSLAPLAPFYDYLVNGRPLTPSGQSKTSSKTLVSLRVEDGHIFSEDGKEVLPPIHVERTFSMPSDHRGSVDD